MRRLVVLIFLHVHCGDGDGDGDGHGMHGMWPDFVFKRRRDESA
jgi:hypothetical protein